LTPASEPIRIHSATCFNPGFGHSPWAIPVEPQPGTLVSRIDTRYVLTVIVSFRHKGLERLYRDGSKRGVQAAHVPKLLRILSALDVAQTSEDLTIPSFKTHPLRGDLAGHWSIWVNGNWRVTFRFVDNDVELVDYQDYH
jgi:proteic killer suppression protein